MTPVSSAHRWLASCATNTEEAQTRLALAHRGLNYAFDSFQHNQVVIMRPAGMSEDVGRQFTLDAQAQLDQRTPKAAAEQHVPICIRMIADLVRAIARLNDTVGPRWSVSLHLARGDVSGISNVGDDPDAMEWHQQTVRKIGVGSSSDDHSLRTLPRVPQRTRVGPVESRRVYRPGMSPVSETKDHWSS
jgi:hypothetical protein